MGGLPPPDTIHAVPLLSIGDLEPAIPPAVSTDKATKEGEPMLLSIYFPPIPGKLVTKIRAGAFIDMKDMLPDNMALLRQLDNFSADKSTSKAKLRPSPLGYTALQHIWQSRPLTPIPESF